ncbi:uncharacterized protein CTRU02_206391 [Colletotrichum truncatum]|uniref:Uncharacterized protein n=1 Tax=Colletotrichum truncatum TaxID=5467 RepID=A0ACC3Z6Q6_COLTU|nr:uncharacterized protein CTRU02_09772 [Colletotrichum truncatum]KAF6787959.1 hypothetical protein CTRU02_09772 [Colletotrichum truncatum]
MRSYSFQWLLAALTTTRLFHQALSLPDNTIELDLLFPRPGGTYAETPSGLPVLIALHNPDVAYHYGWVFSWDVYKQPHRAVPGLPFNTIGAVIGNGTTYPDNPHLETASTGRLEAGKYTFSWTFHTGPWCEISRSSAEYDHTKKVSNGTFEFTVASGAPTPTFTGTCATALGMVSYVSTTVYGGLPFDFEADTATQTLTCGVTTSVTAEPEPCSASVDAAQETSISSRLHWGAFATATASSSSTTASPSAGCLLTVSFWSWVVVWTAAMWLVV